MSLVLNCSATLAFLLPDESTPAASALLQTIVTAGAWTPTHWRLEVANGLASAVRRRRINQKFRDDALTDLSQLPIQTDPHTHTQAWSATLTLADRYNLTIYDAAYLELSLRQNLPLATLDTDLKSAATKAGIPLIPV